MPRPPHPNTISKQPRKTFIEFFNIAVRVIGCFYQMKYYLVYTFTLLHYLCKFFLICNKYANWWIQNIPHLRIQSPSPNWDLKAQISRLKLNKNILLWTFEKYHLLQSSVHCVNKKYIFTKKYNNIYQLTDILLLWFCNIINHIIYTKIKDHVVLWKWPTSNSFLSYPFKEKRPMSWWQK